MRQAPVRGTNWVEVEVVWVICAISACRRSDIDEREKARDGVFKHVR